MTSTRIGSRSTQGPPGHRTVSLTARTMPTGRIAAPGPRGRPARSINSPHSKAADKFASFAVVATGHSEGAMLCRISIRFIALATMLLTSLAGAQAYDESRYPDWSGQWIKAPDRGPPRYDPSKPDGRGQEAPLKEPYRRMHEASMADQATGGQGRYIHSVKGVPRGMPFQMSIVVPFELVVPEKTTLIPYEVMTSPHHRSYPHRPDLPNDREPT